MNLAPDTTSGPNSITTIPMTEGLQPSSPPLPSSPPMPSSAGASIPPINRDNGLQGLRSTLNDWDSGINSLPPPSALAQPTSEDYKRQRSETADRKIDELTDMLECPVCLDTADKEPIYQCPEGHLICSECNGKLVDCPQCGHSLMNARNRTAEMLAERLLELRGNKVNTITPAQNFLVHVNSPQKVGKGLMAYITYKVETKIGTSNGGQGEYVVYRRYRDFIRLDTKLRENYKDTCLIVPPPPAKDQVTSVWAKVTDLDGGSGLGRTIALRCRELDRYMLRLAKHPVIRKDPDFRTFLQESKIAASLNVDKSMSRSISEYFSSIGRATDKLTVTETDIWFKTRELLQKELQDQLAQLKKDIRKMSRDKMALYLATTSFRQNLLESLAVGGSQRRSAKNSIEKEGNDLLKKVADLQNGMAELYLHQAEADELLAFLAMDYLNMLDVVQKCLADRRRALKVMHKKVKKSTNVAPDKMNEIEEYQTDFDKLSQTLRRELEHFDNVMHEEFAETLAAYHKQYSMALKYNQSVHKAVEDQDNLQSAVP